MYRIIKKIISVALLQTNSYFYLFFYNNKLINNLLSNFLCITMISNNKNWFQLTIRSHWTEENKLH